MADAWGLSWGLASSAWGGSWGRAATAEIEHVGDGKSKKKRRRKQDDPDTLFRDMERTLRSVMAGEAVKVSPENPVPAVETGERFDAAVTQLRALSEDSEVLSTRLATLQADIQAYEDQKQRDLIAQDDDEWMMFL